MTLIQITLSSKPVRPHKSLICPDFKAKAAHVSDRFQFVDMWLRQHGPDGRSALVYWRQAANFHKANLAVDALAKPLTSYYCMLNMVKALLVFKGQDMGSVQHGVSGYSTGFKTALTNEIVKFKFTGVLPELSRCLGEPVSGTDTANMSDLLYNIPHIHRAYCMTLGARANRELFIPIQNCGFFKVKGSNEAYFRGELTKNWDVGRTEGKLPKGFEIDPNTTSINTAVRMKKRFNWAGKSERVKILNLEPYHSRVRKRLYHIFDAPGTWYLKRSGTDNIEDGIINKSPLVISFAAMHRLSELSRYDPAKLGKHFDNRYGWLLNEFLARTLDQSLDEITSEITGREVV